MQVNYQQLAKVFKQAISGKSSRQYPLVLSLVGGFLSGVTFIEYDKGQWYGLDDTQAKFNVCFTPPRGCGELIARQLYQAKESIFLQAYSFTSIKIIEQLIAAHRRGVKVYILLDKSNMNDAYSKMELVKNAGISVYIDKVSGIAHNKVIIIDNKQVITGSFNFSNDADKRNAENVLLVNSPELAKKYLENWKTRFQHIKH